MSVPKQYLMVAPDSDDVLGRGIVSSEITKKLRKIDLRFWEDNISGIDLGYTAIWHGTPGDHKSSKKVSNMNKGTVPEFTQLDPEGIVICLGWRRIFEKAIAYTGVNRSKVEAAFGVTLDIGKEEKWCWSCRKQGKLVNATSKGLQCDMHRQVLDNAARMKQAKQDMKAEGVIQCPQ